MPTGIIPLVKAYFRRYRLDVVILVGLGLGMGVFVYLLEQQLNPVIYDEITADAWFDSDIFRVFDNLTDRNSDHYRTNVHPLFSLVAYPPVQVIRLAMGGDGVTAVRIFVAAMAGLWMALLYLLLRLVTGRGLDALLFSLVGGTSAAAFFWLTVPETYVFSSITLIVALLFAALMERKPLGEGTAAVTSAITLSMLLTNWMAGLVVTAVHFPWKRVVRISLNAVAFVVLLWGVQKLIFPSAGFFLESSEDEGRFLLSEGSGGPLGVTRSFFLHTMSMPEPVERIRHLGLPPYPTLMSTQTAAAGSGSIWGAAAVMVWVGLLAFGVKGVVEARKHRRLRLLLILLLLGQFVLYLIYGEETFLYSLNFLPLLILWAAFGRFARERRVVLVMGGLLVVTAGINNYNQFRAAAAFFNSPVIVTDAQTRTLPISGEEQPFGRDRVLAAMRQRPGDPWPRGYGHVVLAIPGSPEVEKGYYEPGGSFSPGVGSFGLSIWVLDNDGRLLTTSDDLLMSSLEQQFVWPEGAAWPGIRTTTPYYESLWRPLAPGEWELALTPTADFEGQVALVVRSVGPAGGPVNQLVWENEQLGVNNRWRLAPSPLPDVQVGHEGDGGWLDMGSNASSWQGDDGWGYAKLLWPVGESSQVIIRKEAAEFEPGAAVVQAGEALNLTLPEEQFMAGLEAQVAHLQMSLVGDETRPGDPINYPLSWQRDAAYIIMALARAGEVEQARLLAGDLAENDFFGGFGAEADAPGLAIWTLTELAAYLDDAAYDEGLWPHIARKAGLIEEMLAAREPMYRMFSGPVIPGLVGDPVASLVADPAREGLIIGRMDHHRPLLYVNAVSYMGLLEAAEFAERLGHMEEAARWRAAADNLRRAWQAAFGTPEANNERTYISGLWPTWIVEPELTAAYANNLEQRRQMFRTVEGGYQNRPLWTYFEVGEAHQWLYLERPDRVWQTLEWFWENQSAPGLYTWWEGAGEENSFRQWEKVRGWVEPPYVSPHYWTTAEMVLLQLDMLVYSRPDGTLVIGGGVPESWLESELHVGPLPIPGGAVEWQWDGREVVVTLEGDPVPVVPGPAFADKPIQLSWE